MKKTLIALGLMSAFGAVHAESSVTLYGNINVAVTKKGSAGVTLKGQEYRYASHIGFTGKEDLGSGYAAIFKLEAELEPDTGSGVYGADKKQFGFNRHSYVGLVTPYGAFRFGRSTTPFVNMWIGGNFGEGRGIGEFTAGLAGTGLRTTQPEVGARWNNAMFYDVKKGGFAAGLAVTTKGSQSLVPTQLATLYAADGVTPLAPATSSVDNEGVSGTKPAYGAYARYEAKSGMWGYKVGAAYQVDNGSSYAASSNSKNAPAESKNAWLVGTGLSYGSATLSAAYAQSKIDNTDLSVASGARLRTGKSKTLFVSLGYDVTPNDHVYASYGRYKRHNNYQFATGLAGEGDIAGSQYSVGYEHRLSKRTVIYANVRKVANITNSCAAKLGTNTLPTASPYYAASCGVAIATVNSVLDTEKDWSYDLGISHKF
jgi:predicted porin